MKFSTIDRRLGSGRRIARTDENVDTVESLRLSQEDKPQSQEKFHLRRGDPSIISFADYSQSSASQVLQARRAQQLTEAHSMHSLFSACSSRDDNVITSNPYMKTETCKLYSRAFWIFLPNIIKIYPYHFELYRLKVGPFLLRHSVHVCVAARSCNYEFAFCSYIKLSFSVQREYKVYWMVLFPVTLSDPNSSFKVTVLFKVECLKTVLFILSNCR